jgi:Heavy metal binding domain
MNVIETKFACPLHQEIQGKLNDKCSICGMFLTIPVGENAGRLHFRFVNFKKFVKNYNRNIIQNIFG